MARDWDEITLFGTKKLAFAFGRLFWPEFVEIEGCILLAAKYDSENFRRWFDHFGGDRSSTEAMINHLHLYDLCLNDATRADEDLPALEDLAHRLMKCWQSALNECDSNRRFVFEFATEPDEYGPTITFFQEAS